MTRSVRRYSKRRGTTPSTTLPGAPDGEYVVFQFDTAFQNKAMAVETVTFVRDADGLWRAVGYFVSLSEGRWGWPILFFLRIVV